MSSCNQISRNVSNSFVEINKNLIDSIELISSQNVIFLDSMNSLGIGKEQNENLLMISDLINNHNQLIDSVQGLIINNSKSISDKTSTNKYIIEERLAKQIQENTLLTKERIAISIQSLEIPFENLNLIEPGFEGKYLGDDWDINMFKGLPAFASIPMMNKWKLENEKCKYLLLNQIIKKVEEENQR